MDHVARYLPTIRALAERALDMAEDASPSRPREGEHVRSLIAWVPVARGLLAGEFVDADYFDAVQAGIDGPSIRFVDGLGHSRPHYALLASGLHRSGLANNPPAHHHDAHVFQAVLEAGRDDFAFDLVLLSAAVTPGESSSNDLVEIALIAGPRGGPLHDVDPQASPDEWTFAELAGLHGLFNAATGSQTPRFFERARSAALYHLHHTQPDYTTNQPWALAAFLWFPETVGFAEQQLHDVQTHLAVEGPPGALVPGLLLADAYATLNEALRDKRTA